MRKPDVYNPYIVVSFDDKGRIYYDILYYDVDDKQWHIGYGSYDLDIVRKYLKEELNVLDTEMQFVPKDRGNYRLEKFLIKKAHPEYSDEQVLAYIQGYEEKETEHCDKVIPTEVNGLYLNIPENVEQENEECYDLLKKCKYKFEYLLQCEIENTIERDVVKKLIDEIQSVLQKEA